MQNLITIKVTNAAKKTMNWHKANIISLYNNYKTRLRIRTIAKNNIAEKRDHLKNLTSNLP